MKIVINIFLIFSFLQSFSQIDINLYKFETINFDSLEIKTFDSNSNKVQMERKEIYKNGKKILDKNTLNGRRLSFTEYYYNGENLVKTKYFSPVYSYNDTIGIISSNNFNEWDYFYTNKLLTKKMNYSSYDGYVSNNYEVVYKYDDKERVSSIITIDKYKGLRASYEEESTKLDSIYNKNENEESKELYYYDDDKIRVEYYRNNILKSVKHIKGSIELPKSIKTFDNENQIIEIIEIIKDKGLNSEIKITKYMNKDVWGFDQYFQKRYNRIKIIYNNKRNPSKIEYMNGSEVVFYDTFKYYTP